MIAERSPSLVQPAEVRLHEGRELLSQLPRLAAYVAKAGQMPLSRHPGWLIVLKDGLQHVPYCLEVVAGEQTRGLLPLAYVQSFLFGRYLVSLPYLNYGECRPMMRNPRPCC